MGWNGLGWAGKVTQGRLRDCGEAAGKHGPPAHASFRDVTPRSHLISHPLPYVNLSSASVGFTGYIVTIVPESRVCHIRVLEDATDMPCGRAYLKFRSNMQ